MAPPFIETDDGRSAAYFHCANRGKSSRTINFQDEEQLAKLRQLIQEADVLVKDFKVGTKENWP